MLENILQKLKRKPKVDFKELARALELQINLQINRESGFTWTYTHTGLGRQISLLNNFGRDFLMHIRPIDNLIAIYPSKYFNRLTKIVESVLHGVQYKKTYVPNKKNFLYVSYTVNVR